MARQTETAWQGLLDKIEIFLSKNWSSHLQMAGLTLLLLTIQIWQISGYGRLSLSVFLAGIICLCEASSAAIRFKQDLERQFQRNTIFLLVLEIISVLFLLVNSRVIIEVIGIRGEVLLIFGLSLAIVAQIVQLNLTAYKWKLEEAHKNEFAVLIVLCFIFGFILNIEVFNTWIRWDSYNYFHSLERQSVKGLFYPWTEGGLKACNHVCVAYALYTLFFRSIPGISHENAMYLSQMFMVAVDLVLIYYIFKKLLPTKKGHTMVLYTIAVICSPWILGRVSDLSMELTMVTGALLLYYAAFYKNYLLGVLATFVLCNSREMGAIVAATVIFVQLIYEIAGTRNGKRFVSIDWCYFVNCFIIGVFWLVLYCLGNWGSAYGNTASSTMQLIDGTPYYQFSFSLLHIKDTLIDSLLVGFNWLFTGVIILAIIVSVVRLIQKRESLAHLFSKQPFWLLMTGLLTFLVEMCAYIAHHDFRYYTLSSVLLCIIGLTTIYYISSIVPKLGRIKNAFPIIIGVLLFLQCHMTIDPVTLAVCPVISTGKASIASMNQHLKDNIDPSFTDFAYANRQVMYFDKALDRAHALIYEKAEVNDTIILFSNEYVFNSWGGSLYQIWGYGYSSPSVDDYHMWSHWDSDRSYRYLSYDPADNIDPRYVNADTDLRGYLNDYEHVYYIKMPWGDTVLEPLMERYSDISYVQTIEYRGWVLEVYRIK